MNWRIFLKFNNFLFSVEVDKRILGLNLECLKQNLTTFGDLKTPKYVLLG